MGAPAHAARAAMPHYDPRRSGTLSGPRIDRIPAGDSNLESAQTLQFGTHDQQLTEGSTRGHDPAAKSARRLSSDSVRKHTSRQNRF